MNASTLLRTGAACLLFALLHGCNSGDSATGKSAESNTQTVAAETDTGNGASPGGASNSESTGTEGNQNSGNPGSGNGSGGGSPPSTNPSVRVSLTVNATGSAPAIVRSLPAGLACTTGQTCTASFEKDTFVSLEVQLPANTQFKGWGGDCSSFGNALTCNLSMNGAKSVSTRTDPADPVQPPKKPLVQLDVEKIGSAAATGRVISQPSGMDCSNGPCTLFVESGNAIALTAIPANGSHFTGWYGAPECESVNEYTGNVNEPYKRTCLISVDRARTVRASFSSLPAVAQQEALSAERCDITVPENCLYPFPNNHFTTAAPKSATNDTGIRVNLNVLSMPRNIANVPINPAEWNRQDGFSPGPKLVTYMAGLDYDALQTMGAPQLGDLSRSVASDSPVLLIDATTGERMPIYIEPERTRFEPEHAGVDDTNRAMTIRVAKNLQPGRRYLVAIREVKRANGSHVEANGNFRAYRDGQPTGITQVEARRPKMEMLFADLKRLGVPRYSLYQAWDFTVASEKNIAGRVLHMRDVAIESLGAASPKVVINKGRDFADPQAFVTDPDPQGVLGQASAGVVEDTTANPFTPYRRVTGHVEVPCFLNTPNCLTGSGMFYTPDQNDPVYGDGLPDRNPFPNPELMGATGTMRATFQCTIPKSIFDSKPDGSPDVQGGVKYPARISLYGHGLLGSKGEVGAGHVQWFSREYNLVMCAMNWTGFATEDVPTALQALVDFNQFPRFIDRQLQGMVNWLILQEAIARTGGLRAQDAFKVAGKPVYGLDEERDSQQRPIAGRGGIFYDGNSQGGIMGGALMAISPRICHGVLGVPGMNYSTLLRRSSDFQARSGEVGYNVPMDNSYRNPLDQAFIFSLVQMLWDRSESNGYMLNLASGDQIVKARPPLRANAKGESQCQKNVLLHVGYGDHQVSIFTAEVMARSIGMKRIGGSPTSARRPVGETVSWFGIPAITDPIHRGSAIVEWESGADEVAAPPLTNTPPRTKADPHEHPRRSFEARVQKGEFMRSNGFLRGSCKNGICDSSVSQRNPLPLADLLSKDAALRSDPSNPAVQ